MNQCNQIIDILYVIQARLLSLIRWMGGSFRESINYKTTHLVSGYACSAKSQYAYLHEIPVIGSSWLHAAWERRDEMEFKAINSSFVSIKIYHSKTLFDEICL